MTAPATIDERHRLTNAHGITIEFIRLGGRITSIWLPDGNGVLADVVPGFDTVDDYRTDSRYFGALIGRFANRIARGRFRLDGVEYELPINDRPNHLHGGPNGFHSREWGVIDFHRDTTRGAVLSCRSVDGEDGYPGALMTQVTYTLSDDDTFRVDYKAVTDAPTVVNLTQHTYFNLRGHDRGDILGHELTVNAAYFTPIDETSIPTGAVRGVIGTAFDFTSPRTIGERIGGADEQLRFVGGYDHNFQLLRDDSSALVTAARLHDPESGRFIEI